MRNLTTIFALSLLAGSGLAQLPTPNPIPAVSPRAHWVLTPNVSGTPTQRRENPGAASQDKMYVFGGRLGNATTTALNALYEFDGSKWTLKTAEGAPGSPPARSGACVAWDHNQGKLMVFGGYTGGSSAKVLGDTWEWDLKTNAWTQLKPATSPSARRYAAMSYDPLNKGMLLFGGMTDMSNTNSNETWLLRNGNWTKMNPPVKPAARIMHSMMHRFDFMDVFMCGGADNGKNPKVRFLDTWMWKGAAWIQIKTSTSAVPAAVNANQAVYDEARKRVVMQGGNGISTYTGGAYGTLYGGTPTSWCSEFDCLTNQWLLYGPASFGTADPVIGRISRYFAAYIPALGKVYKVSGQCGSATKGTCEYQASPLATSVTAGKGCQNLLLSPTKPNDRPWLGRTYNATASGLATQSYLFGFVGVNTQQIPLSLLHPAGVAGCNLYPSLNIAMVLTNTGGSASFSLPIPAINELVGAQLHEQVLQIEMVGPAIKALTSTNSLTFKIGAL